MRLFNIQHRPKGHVSRLPYSSILHLSTVCLLFSSSNASHDFSKNYDSCCAYLRISLGVVRLLSLRIFKYQSGEKVLRIKVASQTLCERYRHRRNYFPSDFPFSLSLFPSFLVKHKLMDCFFDGNRTIRVVEREGIVYRIGTKRMHDAYAQGILRCQLADR